MIDDNVGDAGCNQALDSVFYQGNAADLQQRFGATLGQRAHAFTAASGQHYCAHGLLKTSTSLQAFNCTAHALLHECVSCFVRGFVSTPKAKTIAVMILYPVKPGTR